VRQQFRLSLGNQFALIVWCEHMAKYSIVVLAALLLAGIGVPRRARAQVAADLSAPSGASNFSATGMSANLSATNGAGASRASGGGNGLRAQTRSVSSARFGSITSRPSYRGRSNEMMQEALILPLQAKPKPGLRGFAGTYPSISAPRPTGLGRSSQPAPPASHSSGWRSSSLQTPVYSFLVRNEKADPHSGASQPGLPRRSNHMRKSHGSLMRSLSGLASGGGSDR
jgi:hypothetical protein